MEKRGGRGGRGGRRRGGKAHSCGNGRAEFLDAFLRNLGHEGGSCSLVWLT